MINIVISQGLFSQGCEDEDMGMQILLNFKFCYAGSSEDAGKFGVQAIVTDTQNCTELEFELSPITEIRDSYNHWKSNYYNLVEGTDSEDFSTKGFKKENKNIPSSREECRKYSEKLRNQLNEWLLPVKSELEKIELINPNSEICFVINTQNIQSETILETLHKIPWREWDYFPDCYALEAALCLDESESNSPSVAKSVANDGIFRRVRITSIFGDVENIKEGVERDKEEIEKLEKRGAELIPLEQPQRQDLKQLWDEPCDILFYSGHSTSQGNSTVGRFKINEDEDLSLEEIKNTFSEAIKKGLKIAIFNSCDGLGLACELAKLGLPYIIVWRESVPDEIAQRFIEYFLSSYSQGKSLFDSVKDARIKLKELTNEADSKKQIPGLNWLPIICVSTKDEPPLWEDLGGLGGRLPNSPYQGLSAFGEENAEYFFGREKFVSELVEAVNTKSLVPIIGASGSGKSSVVFAGLVPRLREVGMQIVSFRPGNNAFDSLAIALTRINLEFNNRLQELELEVNLEHDEKALCRLIEDSTTQTSQRFILIIDQFEELYTQTPQPQQQPFLNALLYAVKHAPNFCLVFTLRADFYGHAISHREFSDALQQGIYNSSPMDEEELRAVIEKPAAKMKVELQSGLTDILVDELGQAGSLPLLEFTLSLLWEKHKKWYLTHQAYREIGGLKQALAKYADGILNPLSAVDKEKAERIFIQLISPGEGTEDTKRKATRGEVGEDNWDLVEFLAKHRLVVTGWDETSQQETVEIVHEALIREWGILREWIKSNRRFRIWQERLQVEVVKWDKNRDEKYLLSGGNLGEAEGWYFDEKYQDYLSDAQREFIRLSLKKRDKKIKEDKRKQKWLVGLSVVSLVVAGFAGWKSMQSEIRATSSNLKSLALNSKSFYDGNFHHDAIMEAMKASQLLLNTRWKESIPNDIQQEVKATLFNVINDSIFVKNTFKGHQDLVWSVVFSPDGNTIASASHDNTVKIWDAATGKLIQTLKGHQKEVMSVVFSPEGNTIASASHDDTVKIWDVSTGKLIHTLKGHQSRISSVVFSPDGNTIASVSHDDMVKIWDAATGKLIQTLKGRHHGYVKGVVFSPDGKTVASTSLDHTTVKIWDVATGKTIQILKERQGGVDSVVFSPDSKTIASGLYDNTVKIWDIATGKPIQTLKVHQGEVANITFSLQSSVRSVVFSPDGNTIASTFYNTVKIWDADTGKPIQTLKGHQGFVTSVAFNPDGNTIVSASNDGTMKIWDAATDKPIQTLKIHQNFVVNSVVFSPNGKTIASAYWKTVKILDAATSKPIQTFEEHQNSVNSVVFSPNGKTIASASEDGMVKIWDAATGKPIQTLRHLSEVKSVVFSPDGKTIASALHDGTVEIWDVASRKPIQTLKGHQYFVSSVVFSPNSKTIASASADKTVKIWDAATGKLIQTLIGHQGVVTSVVFSPSGKTIASASYDNTVKIWDAATGKPIQTFIGHQRWVNSVVFSPSGKTIASASDDNTVKIWDAATGKQIQTFKGHQSEVKRVVFSPDGQTIASTSDDKTVKLWNWDFEDLIEKGCERYKHHLANNPEKLEQLEICQNGQIIKTAASTLVKEGKELAKNGDFEGAVQKFRKAKKWNPQLDINPEAKAKAINLVNQGRELASEKAYFEAAVEKFKQAQQLDGKVDLNPQTEELDKNPQIVAGKLAVPSLVNQGRELLRNGDVKKAIATYDKALTIDSNPKNHPQYWNGLCWNGSLNNHAKDVMFACEKAVALQPRSGMILDSRGLARALTGETQGAIEDFEEFVKWTNNSKQKSQRQSWIKDLRNGKNPFTPEVLKELQKQ